MLVPKTELTPVLERRRILATVRDRAVPSHFLRSLYRPLVPNVRPFEPKYLETDPLTFFCLQRSSTCPTCRTEAKSTSDARHATDLVEIYLSLPGNEQEGRSEEDKVKMDESYKPGQLLVKGRREYAVDDEDGFYDEEEDDFGEGDEDGDGEDPFVPQPDVHM